MGIIQRGFFCASGSLLFVGLACLTGCKGSSPQPSVLVRTSDLVWEQLNPARGDKSPQAAKLWGERLGPGPAGFILKPVDGFRSPPHIHNVSYRGVVISGLLHNDDPNAADMWLPAASYWTQPAGEVHITAGRGKKILGYIEVDDGPFRVLPKEDKFDNGQRPVNVHSSNIVWQDLSSVTWAKLRGVAQNKKPPKVAFLWGTLKKGSTYGALLKLPAGFTGKKRNYSEQHVVVIKGEVELAGRLGLSKTLQPGSYFKSAGNSLHTLSTKTKPVILYLRSSGFFEVLALDPVRK